MASFNLRTYGGDWSSSWNDETGSAALTYFLEADAASPVLPTLSDVQDKILDLVGYVDTRVSDVIIGGQGPGHVRRHLPMAHPAYPSLVVVGLRVVPVGFEPIYEASPSDPDEVMEVVPLPTAVSWGSYQFDLTFGQRTYPMFSDDLLYKTDATWTDPDDAPAEVSWYNEYHRFTEVFRVPRDEFVKAKHGQFVFATGSGDLPGGGPPPALHKAVTLAQFPNMPLPDSVVTVMFYKVPLRWITSPDSHLESLRNTINQLPFLEYAPGSLLYRGYSESRKQQPFPDLDPDWGGEGVFAVDPVCDLKLEFWHTKREALDQPEVANDNWITSGWNAFPNLYHNGFFYAHSSNPDEAKHYPMFKSAVHQLLFVDPDAGLAGRAYRHHRTLRPRRPRRG